MKLLVTLAFCAAPVLVHAHPNLRCSGAEPFWSLEMDQERAVYFAPDAPDLEYEIQLKTPASGRVWPIAFTLTSQADTAIAIIAERACNDTMSDTNYSHSIELLTQRNREAIMLSGCYLTAQ